MKHHARKLILFNFLIGMNCLNSMGPTNVIGNRDFVKSFFSPDYLPIELQKHILKLAIMDIFRGNKPFCEIFDQVSQLLKRILSLNKIVRSFKNELINFFLEQCSQHLGIQYNDLSQEQKNQLLKEALLNEEKTEEALVQAMSAVLAGADPNICIETDPKKTPRCALSWAVLWKSPELIRLLLLKGASIDFQNINGYTPLMQATLVGLDPIVELLLYFNADKLLENDDKETALKLAKKNGYTSIINLLNKA